MALLGCLPTHGILTSPRTGQIFMVNFDLRTRKSLYRGSVFGGTVRCGMQCGMHLACLIMLILPLSLPSHGAAATGLGGDCDDMPAAEAVSVGRLRHRANDFAGAVRCLERAAGGDVKAAIYLSESLLRAGDIARAVATLERVIASDSGSRIAFAHLLLGRYHL